MKRALKVLGFLIFWITSSSQLVRAQSPVRLQEVPGPSVVAQGQQLAQPWVGGFNSPQFSAIDLNQDGQPDLFVFDRSSRRVTTFLAVQTNGQWRYQHAPQYQEAFPADLFVFALLRDYNQDGAPDLFTATNLGIRVYRNVTPSGGALAFDLAYPILLYNTNVNLLTGSEDLPAIADMDGDGDLDILMWEWSGGVQLDYFQNQQKEQNLPATELKFTRASPWWGQVTRCVGACNSYKFNEGCPSTHHIGGSSVLPMDLDANGVLDLLVGHDDCPDLVSLYNTGTNLAPKITSAAYNLPPDITGSQFSVFPAAYYLDVTFDGLPDLVVAPNMTSNAHQNVNLSASTWVYPNTGTAAQPRFASSKQPFLQNQMLDLGEGAAPALGNLTGGSGLDLLVGNTALLKENAYGASLSLFKNTGTTQQPAFELVSFDYLGLASQKLLHLKPQLVDLNQDGATDLVYSALKQGSTQVELRYVLNEASAGEPARFSVASAVSVTGVLFFRGDTPYLYDVDQDGVFDLLIGRSSGALQYYRNSGTSTAPVWNMFSESLGGIGPDAYRRRLQILVTDLNQNGISDLLTSDDSGKLRLYPDFASDLSKEFEAVENVLWQPLQQQYAPVRFGPGMALAAADVDQSGRPAVLVGTHAGGVRYLKSITEPLSVQRVERTQPLVNLYPNPARGFTQLVTGKAAAYALYSLAGAKVAAGETAPGQETTIPTQGLASGLYLLRITWQNGEVATQKLIIQR